MSTTQPGQPSRVDVCSHTDAGRWRESYLSCSIRFNLCPFILFSCCG